MYNNIMAQKYTLLQVKTIFKESNLQFLDNHYDGCMKLHNCMCLTCKHIWKTTLARVKKKHNCRKCSINNRRHKYEYVVQYCLEKHIQFLDKEYIDCSTKQNVKCIDCDYEFQTTFDKIKQGRGCPKCKNKIAAEKRKYTLDEVKEIFENKNLIFLDDFYKNSSYKHNCECKNCNYTWMTTLGGVQQNCGCPKCARVLKYTYEQVKQICIDHDFIFLDDYYLNSSYKHNVKCVKCYNCIKTTIHRINDGHGCPNCNRRKNEKITGHYLNYFFPNVIIKSKKINKEIYDENNNKIRNHIIVDYIFEFNNQKYIVEYNGEQHYRPVNFNFKNITNEKIINNFKNQQIRDEWLRNYCKENNIILIEIDGRKYKGDKIKEYLEEQFKNNIMDYKNVA